MACLSDNPYNSARVAEIGHYPREEKTTLSKKKTVKRSEIKSFVRVENYNHLRPMRCPVDIPLDKTDVNKNIFRDSALKCKARREAKVKFEDPLKTGRNKWFF